MTPIEIMLAAVTIIAAQHVAEAAVIECPAQLPADAVQVVRPAPGWTGFVPSFFRLHSVGVAVGQLQDRATLRGDYKEFAHKAYRVTFALDDSKGEKWLMCEYADGQIVQAQRLPDDTKRCDVVYTPDKHGIFAIQTKCEGTE